MNGLLILKLILLNSVSWLIIHLIISILARRIPDEFLEKKQNWFQLAPWEEKGIFWQKWLHIRSWKDVLPDSTLFFNQNYDLSRLSSVKKEEINRFLIETRRAELTHWLSILPAGFFFMWNPPWAGWINLLYAVGVNLPFILIQRYNRPRLEKLFRRIKK